jgi:hypothetical protein
VGAVALVGLDVVMPGPQWLLNWTGSLACINARYLFVFSLILKFG